MIESPSLDAFESEVAALAGDKLLPADYCDRAPASGTTWDYRSLATWRGEIGELLKPLVNDKVKAAFLADPPDLQPAFLV